MTELNSPMPKVAIIDYGMGNLFSVKHACEHEGMRAIITSDSRKITSADAVILPGVGAFGDAIKALKKLDLVGILKDIGESTKPLIGICLGMQLLMSESFEFGHHSGLGIIPGSVIKFSNSVENEILKVPLVGWKRVYKNKDSKTSWDESLLHGLPDGIFMYFIHSYYVQPLDQRLSVGITSYAGVEFCSAINYQNIFACQFHPERSGSQGLKIYRNLSRKLRNNKGE
jgi:glutamine amidotransferase